jgi:hypothetical protein
MGYIIKLTLTVINQKMEKYIKIYQSSINSFNEIDTMTLLQIYWCFHNIILFIVNLYYIFILLTINNNKTI